MLLYATVIPYGIIESENYSFNQELLKILINGIEIFFILMALKNKSSFSDQEAHLKVITVGLAWSLSESLFSYFLYFLFNSTSEEFSWEYIQTSLMANIDLLERIAIVALVECYRKHKEDKKMNLHFLILLISKYAIKNIGSKYIPLLEYNDAWIKLRNHLIITVIFAVIVKMMFSSLLEKKEEQNNQQKIKK